MRATVRAISKIYLLGAVWLFVMAALALALVEPMAPIYSAVGAGPVVRTLGTMAIAIVAASTAAGVVWKRLTPPRRTSQMRAVPSVVESPLAHTAADGQGLAEYALILSLIATVAIVALIFLGDSLSDVLSMIGVTIDDATL